MTRPDRTRDLHRGPPAAPSCCLPARLPLGRGDRGVPDRGRRRRGRPHAVDLGHLRPHARPGRERRHRRRRRRPLPPVPRATSRSWPRSVSPSYRFSVAWPRITPHVTADGLGPVNDEGLDFYSTLVDDAARRGHHALPSRSTTGTCRRRWRTRAAGPSGRPPSGSASTPGSSPPRSATGCRSSSRSTSRGAAPTSATRSGVHAPGRTDPAARARRRPPPQPRARARRARRSGRRAPTARVGVTLNLAWVRPGDRLGRRPGRRPPLDGLQNRVFLDPILHGRYPADVVADTAGVTDWAFVQPGDLDVIAAAAGRAGPQLLQPPARAALDARSTRGRPPTGTATAPPPRGSPATTSSSRAVPARRPTWAGASTPAG